MKSLKKQPLLKLIEKCEFAEPQIVGNIAMIGLLDQGAPDKRTVLSLDKALKSAEIEILDTGGYTELTFSPRSPVLLRASEGILKGGKQDRIVKKGRVLDKREVLDVYCIEQGRWSRAKTNWTPINLPAPIRRAILDGRDQHDVWGMIREYLKDWNVNTRTQALGAIYDALGGQFEKFVANFEWWEDQIGMIVVINNVVSGLELFDSKQNFREDGMRLLRDSYVPEALRGTKKPVMPENTVKSLEKFEKELENGKRRTEVVLYKKEVVYASAI